MTHFYTSPLNTGVYEICKIVACSIFTIFIQPTFRNPSKGITNSHTPTHTHRLPCVRMCVYLYNLLPPHTAAQINICLCSKIINSSVFVVTTCVFIFTALPYEIIEDIQTYLHEWIYTYKSGSDNIVWVLKAKRSLYENVYFFLCLFIYLLTFLLEILHVEILFVTGLFACFQLYRFIYLLDRC